MSPSKFLIFLIFPYFLSLFFFIVWATAPPPSGENVVGYLVFFFLVWALRHLRTRGANPIPSLLY